MQSQFENARLNIFRDVFAVGEQIRGYKSDPTAAAAPRLVQCRMQRSVIFYEYYRLVLANYSGSHAIARERLIMLLGNARRSRCLSDDGLEMELSIMQAHAAITIDEPTNVPAHPTGSALQQSQPSSCPPHDNQMEQDGGSELGDFDDGDSDDDQVFPDSERLVSEIPYRWIDYQAEEDAFFRSVRRVAPSGDAMGGTVAGLDSCIAGLNSLNLRSCDCDVCKGR